MKKSEKPLEGDLLGGHDYSSPDDQSLKRGLSNRHIQLISLGGAVGTGLFMGAGKTISLSGSSVILVYAIIGFFLFMVMRAMGELLLSNLKFKSFADFAAAYLGPWAGFFVGWSYWMTWVLGAIADYVVIGGFMQFWYPTTPVWVFSAAALAILIAFNLFTVKVFGELEFWFALIKVITICCLILTGLYLIFSSYVSPNGVEASLYNITNPNIIFPHGIFGFFAGFQIAIFSFAGIELIGTTAAEAKNPEKNLPKAINAVPVRVLLFYILSIGIVIAVSSWEYILPDRSPFVQLFILSGLPAAAAVINFVVTTSAMSAANSGVFSTSRMLYGLSVEKDAPNIFSKLSSSAVPVLALVFSGICMLIGITLLFLIPNVMEVFTLVSTVAAILYIFTWSMIVISYIAYRKNHPELHMKSKFKMPGGVWMSWLTLLFFAFVLTILTFEPDTRKALMYSPLWFVLLTVVYKLKSKSERSLILRSGIRKEV